MIPKNARLRRTEGLLLLVAIGVVTALYLASSGSNDKASPDQTNESNSHGHDNANSTLDFPPAAANSVQRPATPLELLVNRPHRRPSAQEVGPNSLIDSRSPARAIQMPSAMAAPGPPSPVDQSMPQHLGTEKGLPGRPIDAKMLDRSSRALRIDDSAAGSALPR